MNKFFIPVLLLLLFLAACQPQTVTVEKDGEVEVIEVDEDSPSAVGSEDDSGALPPPINSGSKVSTNQENSASSSIDVLFIIEQSEETAVFISELEENWESIVQQVSALPPQPEVQYAALILNTEESFTFTDFAPAPLWDDLVDRTDSFENIAEAATQLSWTETESQQLIFILLSPATLDETFLIGAENSFNSRSSLKIWRFLQENCKMLKR